MQGDPADIAHLSTICGTVACGIMGIKNSGFQELADVSFVVKDSVGKPVSGVPVTFELEGPPTGTAFLGDAGADAGLPTVTIKTDSTGKATARVQSGNTLGVFTVKASVSPTLQAKSPAIGVRGVTPANGGFTLQCALKNMPAYVSAAPPLALKTSCTVTLVDRFNNPVGKPTIINLKVEAGAIPSSVQSTAFSPTGANADEGKAVVDFSTVGTFPAYDVPALPGEQFSGSVNQRDGLVTILAYVAGEEAFEDNNQNGKWDTGENFIDQGEPFVDRNDNNTWDIGETYADVAPTNGKWDPPNKVWDKQTTIWTTAYILYSGEMTRATFNPAGPLVAPVLSEQQLYVSFADDRFNNPPPGASTAFTYSRTGVRGSVTNAFENMIDGYSFDLTRALYDGDNPTVACTSSVARCEWLTKFTFNPNYRLGVTATIKGAATAGIAEAAELTFSPAVAGVKQNHKIGVTFQ